MENDLRLEAYLDLCQSVFERMKRDGTWPWRDSQFSPDLVESLQIKKDA
jgi:hypothetical protein